ncbi:hypothetical protein PRZ48_011118 [Zasmidium cellare]|uniref:Mitochondrial carrier protein n=1 Tax=Zasmidium cellare TaxID=395010 RepID=A0ABR0EB14_ZASCE|nr:hypothetical protein PRZ48_011118 [Zasmidium cellare]
MSADFWSGYVSGAIGILVGNPLDIFKTKLQAGTSTTHAPEIPSTAQANTTARWTSFARGSAAPILGYGALNGLLFYTYNRSLSFLSPDQDIPPPALATWTSGALGGLATFFVSAPTELVKCRAQVAHPAKSSWEVTRELWASKGLRGLYLGGGVTSVRDAVGFYSYELTKRAWSNDSDSQNEAALKVLLCGGLAGVVTHLQVSRSCNNKYPNRQTDNLSQRSDPPPSQSPRKPTEQKEPPSSFVV